MTKHFLLGSLKFSSILFQKHSIFKNEEPIESPISKAVLWQKQTNVVRHIYIFRLSIVIKICKANFIIRL